MEELIMPVFDIARYSPLIRDERLNNAQAEIMLYDNANNQVGQLYFMAPGVPTSPSSFSGGVVRIFYPMDAYLMAIDMLRNERPVRLRYNAPNVAFITASLEDVGEDDG
jgi:hypothetical protein